MLDKRFIGRVGRVPQPQARRHRLQRRARLPRQALFVGPAVTRAGAAEWSNQ